MFEAFQQLQFVIKEVKDQAEILRLKAVHQDTLNKQRQEIFLECLSEVEEIQKQFHIDIESAKAQYEEELEMSKNAQEFSDITIKKLETDKSQLEDAVELQKKELEALEQKNSEAQERIKELEYSLSIAKIKREVKKSTSLGNSTKWSRLSSGKTSSDRLSSMSSGKTSRRLPSVSLPA